MLYVIITFSINYQAIPFRTVSIFSVQGEPDVIRKTNNSVDAEFGTGG